MRKQRKRGIIFDMDGTLFDTETLGLKIGNSIIAGMGYPLRTDFYASLMGGTRESNDVVMKKEYGDSFDVQFFYDEWARQMESELDTHEIPKKEGLDSALETLHTAEYLMAVASTTKEKRIRKNLLKAGIDQYFSAVIGGDMVQNGKPHPEIFCRAAEGLSLDPQNCVAVEDSANGILSAHAAGCTVVIIPDLYMPSGEILAKTAVQLASLQELPEYVASLNKNL